jgi:hypothetical protein
VRSPSVSRIPYVKTYYCHTWSIIYYALKVLVFWVETLCGLVGRYQCFGGTYCLLLQCCPTSPHVFTTQKTNTEFFTTVRTSKLLLLCIICVPSVFLCLCVSSLTLLNGFHSCFLFFVVYTKSGQASLILIGISPELMSHLNDSI